MSLYQEEYNMFAREVNAGYLCEGVTCPGQFVSDFDTLHICPCGKKTTEWEEPLPMIREEVGQFAILDRTFHNGPWAVMIAYTMKRAIEIVKSQKNPSSFVIKKITKENVERICFQVEKFEDWASD